MKIKIIIPLILSIIISLDSYCQRNVKINHYVEDKLPISYISTLIFDKNDRLIIGTPSGLFCYNGLNYIPITTVGLYPRISYSFHDHLGQTFVIDAKNNIHKITSESIPNTQFINEFMPGVRWELMFYGSQNFKNFNNNKIVYYFESKYKEVKDDERYFNFIVDKNLIIPSKTNKWYSTDSLGKVNVIKTRLPYDINIDGLIFYGSSSTYLLYDDHIYQLKLYNNELSIKTILNNVGLDKKKDALNCGVYNEYINKFYFGSTLYGLYEVIPALFTSINHDIADVNSNKKHISYYSQVALDTNKILINNSFIQNSNGSIEWINSKKPFIRALNFKDKNEYIYYSNQNELIQINNFGKKVNKWLFPGNKHLLSMTQLNNDQFITCSEDSIFVFDKKHENPIDKLSFGTRINELINYIHYLKENDELIVLTNQRIIRWSMKNKKLSPFSNLKGDFRIFKELKPNLYFIGSYGSGYYIMTNQKIYKMPLDVKQNLLYAHTALIDKNNFVWISTNNGLYQLSFTDILNRIEGQNNTIYYYLHNKNHGFKNNEFNGGCQTPALVLKNGNMSFSSINGLVQFNPVAIKTIFPSKPPAITEILVEGKIIEPINNILKLNKDDNKIIINTNITYFGDKSNLNIEYKIRGLKDKWAKLNEDKNIIIEYLPHGEFFIDLRAKCGFGQNDFLSSSLKIVKPSHFYETDLFKLMLFFLFICSLFFIYYLTRYFNKLQKNKLNKIIKDQTNTLSELNTSLKQQLSYNELFQSMLLHDLFGPTRFIKENSALISSNWFSFSEDLRVKNIRLISETSGKIYYLISDILNFLSNKQTDIKSSKFKVFDELSSVKDFFQSNQKIYDKKIKIIIDCQEDLTISINKVIFSAIIRNLLANSITHSDSGNVTLYCFENDDHSIVFGCKDEGYGMDPEIIANIEGDNYVANDIRKDSFKLGYIIIKNLLKIINGKINIKSKLNFGTDVSIEVKN